MVELACRLIDLYAIFTTICPRRDSGNLRGIAELEKRPAPIILRTGIIHDRHYIRTKQVNILNSRNRLTPSQIKNGNISKHG